MKAIRVDDETTWPTGALELLANGFEALQSWVAFRLDLDRRYEAGDASARYDPPANPHPRNRDWLLRRLTRDATACAADGLRDCGRRVVGSFDSILVIVSIR